MKYSKFAFAVLASAFSISVTAQLEEIVVTATKRAESLQDVPIAMQAFSQEQLNKLGVQTASDITKIAPNINISTQNPVSQAISIRGVGTNDFFSNSAGSVGIYMDEVTMSAPALGGLALHDLERVEVLRGPQNTLFGRNTTGGAVNYISTQPSIGGETDGFISATYGRYNRIELDAAATFQVSQNSAIRLAAKSYDRDGNFNNLADGGSDIGEKDRKSIRATWAWQASDNTLVTANVHYGREDSEITPYRQIGLRLDGGNPNFFTVGPFPTFFSPGVELDWTTNYGGVNAQGRSVDTTDWQDVNIVGDNRHDVEATGAYLKIEHEFEFATLTSITSVDNSETAFQIDFGGPGSSTCATGTDAGGICVGPNPLAGPGSNLNGFSMFNGQDHENDQFSQEIRLTSSGDGPFRWIAGLYYYQEDSVLHQNMGFGTFGFDVSNPLTVPGGPPWPGQPVGGSFGLLALTGSLNGYSNQASFNTADLENEVISPYFRTEFDINEKATITFGLRYTDDNKSANNIVVGTVDTSSLGVDDYRSRSTITALAAGLSDCASPGPNPFTGNLQGLPCQSDITRPDLNFSGVGGKIGLDYRFNDDVMVYGSYSRGFRSGKYDIEFFHGPNTGFPIVDLEEETLDAYEIGIKSSLLENTLELNASFFSYTWNDQQLFDVNPLTGPTFLNVKESDLMGAEVELKWAPGDGWYVQGSVGFLDTEIKDQGDDPDGGGPDDLIEVGHELPNAPEFSYNLVVSKDISIASGNLQIQANVEHRDGAKTAQTTRAVTDTYEDFTSLGLRADYSWGDSEQYQVSLIGENLSGEEVCNYKLDLVAFSGTAYCLPNDGEAMYGVSGRMSF